MKGSTLASAVGVTLLFVHGILVLIPMRENVAHAGHGHAFVAELVWVLWENRLTVNHLRAAIRHKK